MHVGATPHKHMFTHVRRSYNGCSLSMLLTHPGPILMENHARTNKYELNVQEVELNEANLITPTLNCQMDIKTSVSIWHLAHK